MNARSDVQATPLPQQNSCFQYEPVTVTAEQLTALRRDPEYPKFMQRVRGDMELCLLQNTVLDTLADDFGSMEEEEALKGHRSGKPISEIMSFVDIRHCKDMQVSDLRWHPHFQLKFGVCARTAGLLWEGACQWRQGASPLDWLVVSLHHRTPLCMCRTSTFMGQALDSEALCRAKLQSR